MVDSGKKLEKFQGNLYRSAVEMAKDWEPIKCSPTRGDANCSRQRKLPFIIRYWRCDRTDDEILAIGSGGMFALSAARLTCHSDLSAREIVEEAMKITETI
ncbi:MAG: hypothetical protein CM1200mP16_15790 [Nitrospina sp.]|nr:MAG: hypothetical protein CM1200mP16_15790 [Nitrospina sp.]